MSCVLNYQQSNIHILQILQPTFQWSPDETSNMTGRHRGPKRMLRAGYRALSLQQMSYLCELLLCEASSSLHCRVWYRTLSLRVRMLCTYSMFGHHLHPLGYWWAKFRFCGALRRWTRPWRRITYSIKSLTQSLTEHIWSAGNRSLSLQKKICIMSCTHIWGLGRAHLDPFKSTEVILARCSSDAINDSVAIKQ